MDPSVISNLPTVEREPDYDFTHHFKGFGIHKSECHVQMWMDGKGHVAILLTDTGKGTSVTNAAEQIIEELYHLYLKNSYPKENCLWIETYNRTEGLDIIVPTWKGDKVIDVDWRHLGKIVN